MKKIKLDLITIELCSIIARLFHDTQLGRRITKRFSVKVNYPYNNLLNLLR